MIKEILEKLSDADKQLLMCALEGDLSQEVALADGTFIGVNIYVTASVEVIEEINHWLYGRRK